MQLTLVENGLDSLEYGIDYYCKFLELEDKFKDANPTYLKMALIMIHNSTELFIKSYLNTINELLIYSLPNDKKKKEEFLFHYSKRIKNPENNLEYYLLTEDSSVKTKDYSELIEVYKAINIEDYKEFWCLKKLGDYRNKVSHFGINLQNEYYGIIEAINGSLDIIFEKLHCPLKNDKYKKLYKIYNDIFIEAEEVAKERWASNLHDTFLNINIFLKQAIEDSEIKGFLKDKEASVRWKPKIDSPAYPNNEILVNGKSTRQTIYTINVPFLNVTFFADDLEQNGPIFFIVEHLKNEKFKNLFVFKKPMYYKNFEYTDNRFWILSEYSKNRENRDFNYDNFKYAFLNSLKCILG